MAETPDPGHSDLDRHALVMGVWLATGLLAAVFLIHAFGGGSVWAAAAGFAVLLAGFGAHVIVNAVWRTGFTPGELALGLCVYGAGLVWFLLSLLLGNVEAARLFVPIGVGFIVILVAVVFYLVTFFGVRRTFERFDVIREFRPQRSGRTGG